ncbi:MAG: F0F1 ATP synthase subunit alpha [Candidatus Omnitrophota bacterium]
MKSTPPSLAVDVREVGYVKSIHEFIVNVNGLPSCFNGQIVEFENGGRGLVMGFKEDTVQVLLFGSSSGISLNDEVYNKGQPLYLPVGEEIMGRVVNSFCEPVDNLGPIETQEVQPVFREAPAILDRLPVQDTLETGTIVLDTLFPIAKGQRQLFLGDRLTGKTTVTVDTILNQAGKDVICIYACIGKPYTSFLKTLDLLCEKEALSYTVVVSGIASASVGEQYLAPYTAAMLGEYFMYQGKNVLVVFDDLTRHAWIYRQISLLLGRAPGREAYPGDIFYIHSQLVERAGRLKPELKGGSMTFLPIIEILQGDLTGYIPTNLISMTDGQTYFDSDLFRKGIKPAIDVKLSVSRIGSKAQWPAMREVSKRLRLDYLRYQELLRMSRISSSSISKEAEKVLKHGEVITHLITQNRHQPVPVEVQICYLYALNLGILDQFSLPEIKKFESEFINLIQQGYPEILGDLRTTKELSAEAKNKLNEVLKHYLQEHM